MSETTVDRFRCTIVSDGRVGPIPAEHVVLDEAVAARIGNYETPMNVVVLVDGAETILIDAGWGAGPARGLLVDGLRGFGIGADAVTDVLITHLHGDHAGGLMTDGALTFPRARVNVSAEDVAWARETARGETATIDALEADGLLRGVDDLPAGVAAIPTPGHTPGHVVFEVAGTPSLIVGGDTVMIPDHLGDPSIPVSFDADRDAAEASRRTVIARTAEAGTIASWYHLEPALGRVRAHEDAWSFRRVTSARV